MLTTATDIYAYAIVCIEVLRMGELPWGCTSDEDLRHGVLGSYLSFLVILHTEGR